MSSTDQRSASKQRLLEKRLNRKIGAAISIEKGIPLRPTQSEMLASPGQARIWLLHHLDENSPGYNITSSFFINSPVDRDALEWSFNRVISRHEVLRSVYHLEDTKVVLNIKDFDSFRIVNPVFKSKSDLLDAAHQFAQTPFNLRTGPLVRMRLFTQNAERHLLVLTIHDLIFDKWSLKIFWKEVSEFYRERTTGQDSQVPKLEIQFSDFAYWQKRWLESGEGAKQIDYWKNKLSNPPSPINLPTDYPISDKATDKGQLQRSRLSDQTTMKLRELATNEGCTLFMVLILGFNLLLRRYSNDEDILISSPVANRRKKETADLIGFFLNTIILRYELNEEQTIREALDIVKRTSIEALDNQDVPLDSIVEAIKPSRVPGRLPLFQTMFIFQREDEGAPQLHLENCDVEPTYIETYTSKFELSLFVAESGLGMETIVEYRSDLFKSETINEFLDRFAIIMEKLVSNPDQTLKELNILSKDEIARVSAFQKGPFLDLAEESLIHEQINRQFTRNPEAVAVAMEESEITYAELEMKSNNIAAQILNYNLAKSEPIALYLDKSPNAISGLLGILKSGHPYLPIDPSYPKDRVRFIAKDARIGLVLSSSRSGATELFANFDILDIDDINAQPEQSSPISLPDIKGSDTAYIIYTSGTSGTPKGVAVSQDNLRHTTCARINYYEEFPENFLLIPSLSFDSSIATIFWTLSTGKKLVIPTSDELLNPDLLLQLIEKQQVSTILCVPTFYESLLEWDLKQLDSLRTCIVAGESCSPRLVKKHFEKISKAELYNEYGPTETSVWASVHKCDEHDAKRSTIPIGKPIANCEIRILSPSLLPIPPIHSGEILISGEGISLGYLNREDLNRSKFVKLEDDKLYYRTGDLGKWNSDGEIEFFGRNDNQVKVRGYRIEPEEIEIVLSKHPEIEKATVVASPVMDESDWDDSELENIVDNMEESIIDEILTQIENKNFEEQSSLGSSKTGSRIVNRDKFALFLDAKTDDFISPPRKAQRDWLIRQAMEEVSDDLEHLDRIAKTFVPGKDHKLDLDLVDITKANLNKDEIMEDWQVPLMKMMASYATESGGDILEIGFGRGVSSQFIQEHGVRSHTIVEMNEASIENYFEPWKKSHPNSDIRLHHARWQDVEPEIGLFDGIFFHAFPMNEEEFVEYVLQSVTFAEHSFPKMADHLKPGGIFTYLSTEIDSFSRRHQRLLFKYFSEISLKIVPVEVPEDTVDTWWAKSMVAVKAVK